MTDFICFEAVEEEDVLTIDEKEELMAIDDLIDDTHQETDDHCFHRFHNQQRDTSEIMEEILREEEAASEKLEHNNYLHQNEIEDIANEVYDETDDFLKSRDKFLGSLINPIDQTKEKSFYLTLLHSIRYVKNKKTDFCAEKEMEKEIGSSLYLQIQAIKDICILDLNYNNFEEMCYRVNDILITEKMFLRVYEIKDNYRYLFQENKDSKKVLRSLSSCIKEKFNGFTFADLKLSRENKTDVLPITILYKPVRKQDEVIKCYFVQDLRYAYRSIYQKIQKDFTGNTLYECYYCNDFWIIKSKYEKTFKNLQ